MEINFSPDDIQALAKSIDLKELAKSIAAHLHEQQSSAPAATTPLDTVQAAEYLGCSKQLLEGLRHTGGGPVYSKPPGSRLVRYRVADLDAWLASGARAHTSEQRGKS